MSEETVQSVYFAAYWAWVVSMLLAAAQLAMSVLQPHSMLAAPVMAARAAHMCFGAMFALQIPLRFQRLPFAQHQQFLLFHVFELAARCFVMGVLWFYLAT